VLARRRVGVGSDRRAAGEVVARGDGGRGSRPVGQRYVDHAQLDQFAHGAEHTQLGEPESCGQLAHGAPRGHGHERLPAVGADGHLVGRQVAGECDLVLERRNDGLELVPFAQQRVRPAEHRVDVLGLAAGGGRVVAVEGEVARLEPQQLEHDLVDGGAVDRAVRVGVDHAAVGQPHVAAPAITLDPEPTGLRRRRQ
jgi:hypothetical protein